MRLQLLVTLFILIVANVFAQQQDTTGRLYSKADQAIYTVTSEGDELDTLLGQVIIVQDSLSISSDRAYILNQIRAKVAGNVVIITDDSTTLFAHRSYYDGLTKIALMAGEVILERAERRLYTDSLRYDVEAQYAEYRAGGTIIDPYSKLISREGDYHLQRGIANFRYNVQYQDSTLLMYTDSVQLHYATQRIYLVAPTRIETSDSTTIYCESGIYSIKNQQGVLSENVQIRTNERYITAGIVEYDGRVQVYKLYLDPVVEDSVSVAQADTIIFDDKKGLISLLGDAEYTSDNELIDADQIYYDTRAGTFSTTGVEQMRDGSRTIEADEVIQPSKNTTLAMGGVVVTDTVQGVKLWTDMIDMDQTKELSVAYGDSIPPLLEYYMSNDTLSVIGDTMLMQQSDSAQVLYVRGQYKLSSGSISGVGEEMQYYQSDSLIVLVGDPILWIDSTQLSADTIKLYLTRGQLTDIELIDQAFIITQSENNTYNQINGKLIVGKLQNGTIHSARVLQNARMVYHVEPDDDTPQGLSSTTAVEMYFIFEQGEVSSIDYQKPESKYYASTTLAPANIKKLEGFKWEVESKPPKYLFTKRKEIDDAKTNRM